MRVLARWERKLRTHERAVRLAAWHWDSARRGDPARRPVAGGRAGAKVNSARRVRRVVRRPPQLNVPTATPWSRRSARTRSCGSTCCATGRCRTVWAPMSSRRRGRGSSRRAAGPGRTRRSPDLRARDARLAPTTARSCSGSRTTCSTTASSPRSPTGSSATGRRCGASTCRTRRRAGATSTRSRGNVRAPSRAVRRAALGVTTGMSTSRASSRSCPATTASPAWSARSSTALRDGPLTRPALFGAIAALEQPPWLGDLSLAAADALAPLVERSGDDYARTASPRRRFPSAGSAGFACRRGSRGLRQQPDALIDRRLGTLA